jgi:hypothetical protein
MIATTVCALSAFSPSPQLQVAAGRPGAVSAVQLQNLAAPAPMMNLGRRAALAGVLLLPSLQANADSIEEIAARANKKAEEARSPEALKAKEEADKANENNQAVIGLGIGGLLLAATATSLAPVSENVKRVGKKIQTGKNQRKY